MYFMLTSTWTVCSDLYKWMHCAHENTTYIQNNEKLESNNFFTNLKTHLQFVKIRDFPEFLKFVKFAFSICYTHHGQLQSHRSQKAESSWALHAVSVCSPWPGCLSQRFLWQTHKQPIDLARTAVRHVTTRSLRSTNSTYDHNLPAQLTSLHSTESNQIEKLDSYAWIEFNGNYISWIVQHYIGACRPMRPERSMGKMAPTYCT